MCNACVDPYTELRAFTYRGKRYAGIALSRMRLTMSTLPYNARNITCGSTWGYNLPVYQYIYIYIYSNMFIQYK